MPPTPRSAGISINRRGKVKAVRALVQQVDQASLAVTVPNLNASLAAVHQFKRGG